MSELAPSPRAQEVAALVAKGLTYAEAADELGISVHTVKTHASHVGSIMRMPPRRALIVWHHTKTVPPRDQNGQTERVAPDPDDGTDQHDDPTPVDFGGVALTKRQLEVAELVARGIRYRDIGRRLGGISEKTVSTHVQAICAAIGRETGTVGARQRVAQWYHEVHLGVEESEGPCVYFIQAENGLIKIGVSDDVARRLAYIQSVSPVDVQLLGSCPGGYRTEAKLHERFREHMAKGEWFEPSDELLREIESITQTGDAA